MRVVERTPDHEWMYRAVEQLKSEGLVTEESLPTLLAGRMMRVEFAGSAILASVILKNDLQEAIRAKTDEEESHHGGPREQLVAYILSSRGRSRGAFPSYAAYGTSSAPI